MRLLPALGIALIAGAVAAWYAKPARSYDGHKPLDGFVAAEKDRWGNWQPVVTRRGFHIYEQRSACLLEAPKGADCVRPARLQLRGPY